MKSLFILEIKDPILLFFIKMTLNYHTAELKLKTKKMQSSLENNEDRERRKSTLSHFFNLAIALL